MAAFGTTNVMPETMPTMSGSENMDGEAIAVPGCAFCNSPQGKQTLFGVAILLLTISWFSHVHSVME